DIKLLRIAKAFKPDIFVGKGSVYMGQVSKMLGKPYICFSDTEHATLANMLTYPFADVICTPSCFKKKINAKKHIRYNGYEELAYLHPKYFKPDPSVLDEAGLSKNDKFIIIRFVSWGATHDIGDRGFINREKVVKTLERYGQVLVSSEAKLSHNLEKYRINSSPEKIHHLLYFAHLYIGESAPMATESAILGTPSIFVSSSRRGYTDELESRYGLVYNFSDPKTMQANALKKAVELLENKNAKREWRKKRAKMLSEKIDVTAFITELIDNFIKKVKKNRGSFNETAS
ncbi:MAG: hypothetical protein DRP08_06695, partial [Candidatus Aenigmatarchaeota archaeon]